MALTRITKGVIKPNENYDTHDINSTGIITATGANITGNLTVGGVLTYEDVSSIDSVGIITANQGIHVGAGISAVGIITARQGVRVPDGDVNNNYISAGDSQDIKIYHDGSHSYIRDIGTGGLRITSNSFNVLNSTNGESMITGTEDGAVKLYYDHNLRLETSGSRTIFRGSGGIGVYGDAGSNQNGQISIHPTGSAVYSNLYFYNAAGNSYASIIGHAGGTLFFTGGTNGPLRHRVNGTGFHSFQEGNTQRVTITAGGTVNIGGDFTNTTGKLKVTGNSIFTGDIDVDGHTNLDNVSIAGVTTMGQTTIFTTGGTTLLLKDSDSSNPADRSGIAFVDQNNTQTAFIGKESASDSVLTINNTNTINPIRLKVNNTTRLEVGNTGVYATGSLSATGTLSAGGILYIPDDIQHSGDADTKIRFPSNDLITFETAGTERLRIFSSGNVNIGAGSSGSGLSPILHLHKNASSTAYLHITNNNTGITNNDGFLLGINGVGDCLVFNKDETPIRFATAGLERLRITSAGLVGIGEASPSSDVTLTVRKDVAAASGNATMQINNLYQGTANQSNASGAEIEFKFKNHNASHDWWGGRILCYNSDNYNQYSYLRFDTASQGNAVERMRLNHDGDLTLFGKDNAELKLKCGTSSGNNIIAFQNSGGTTRGNITYDSDDNFLFFNVNQGEKLRITSTGQVRLPNNGQQLTWGASQQMKFYYENSEDRMYLQGDGEYGFAFRVNGGNALEIQKTTRDVIMQGGSGRNFQWDNSEPSLYLTDNGTNSARLKIGTGGDLQLYHDVSGNVNHIVAATNGTIKISGGVEFYDYTGVTKRAIIDSNGLRIGTVSAPTLPTTGAQPMIMRNATYFTKEIHRTISDYRSLCDGTHSGYLLLIPAYPGSGTVSAKKFYGTITCDRGGTGSGNSTQVATVHAATAYSNDQFFVENARNSQYIVSPAKVTYNGTQYLALKFGQSGGGPHNGIHIDGQYHNVDSNFLRLVRQNEIDSVQNDNHGAVANHNAQYPICGVMVVDMDGTPLNDNSIRYMRGGTVHFEYSPAGTDCYNNGIFTAQVNGIYHVTAGVLTGNNVGRVEFSIQRQVSGGSYQNVVNFNGAANFSNSHNGPTATAFIKMKAGWNLRVYRVSSNQGAYSSTHGNNYFGAVLMHGLMDSQV